MMIIKRYFNLLVGILLLILLGACKDTVDPVVLPEEEHVALYITAQLPVTGKSAVRAVNEVALTSMSVAVFESDGTNYLFSYVVTGYSITSTGTDTYDFYARISPTQNAVKLYLLGNTPGITNSLTPGLTEVEVKEVLTGSFTPAGFDGSLPMFGEIDFTSGLTADSEVDVVLVRSIARADVINTAADFELTSIRVYRANDTYQIIPDALVNDVAIAPSIPGSATPDVNTNQLATTSGALSVEQVYIPESAPAVTAADSLAATCIVIGGIFGDDEDPTFYRLDFVPDGTARQFGQILRNHRYQFNITEVQASGWTDPDEAANNKSTQFQVEIKEWNESTTDMVFDDVYYFGVSARYIRLGPSGGSQQTVTVDTNLDTYRFYWANADGSVPDNTTYIEPGGRFTNIEGEFTVEIAADGTRFTVTTETGNTGTTRYLLAEAGRLRLLLTIEQAIFLVSYRALNVIGSTNEIGRLGDYVFGNNSVPDRAQGLVPILRNVANFGPVTLQNPDPVVPFPGINIAGQATYTFPTPLLELFDVLYLTYAGNPYNGTTTIVTDWLAANTNRVLIVQYDNTSTNQYILNALLGTASNPNFPAAQITPFTLYPDPPEQIMNGPFGIVDPNMQYRCFDTTHGEIDYDLAVNNGITPILRGNRLEVNGGPGMVLGVDFNRRIVYCGDIDLYNSAAGGSGEYLPDTGTVPADNNAAKLMANLWAWIVEVALTEE